LFCFSRCSI